MPRPGSRARHHRPRALPLRGIETLESRLLLSTTLIPLTDHRDLVVDSARNELIIVSSTGIINRYNISSGQSLTPINLNISAGGADISPDGQYLYVTQKAPSGTLTLDRIDLSTGATVSFATTVSAAAGFYDCAVLADGRVELTTISPGAGQIFVELDPTTLQFAADSAFTNAPAVKNANAIFRSADGSSAIVIDPAGTPDTGGIRLLTLPDTETQLASGSLALTDATTAAVNQDGSLYALDLPAGVELFNQSGSLLSILTGIHGGLTFSPSENLLYIADPAADVVHRINVSDPAQPVDLADSPIGEPLSTVDPFGNGQVAVSPDGSELFVATTDGIRIVNRPASPSTATIQFSAPATANYQQQIALSATVTSANAGSGQAQPTGFVSFFDGSATPASFLGSVPLTSGTASLTVPDLSVGAHTVTAIYSGDANFDFAQASLPVTTEKITPQLSILIQNHTSNVVGYTAPFIIEVDAGGAGSSPVTGTITLTNADSQNFISNATLNGGAADFSFAASPKGVYHIRADYSGTSAFNATSATYTVTVAQVGPAITLQPPADGSYILQATLSSDVSAAPTGNLILLENGQPVLSAPINNWIADFDLSKLPPGPHTFTASYSGDATFLPAVSQPLQQNIPLNATLTLSAGVSVATINEALSLTATLSPAVSGSVAFYDDGTLLGTAPVSNGTAILPATSTASGQISYSAVFEPDGNYLHATAGIPLTVYQPTILDLLAVYTPQELASASGNVATILALIQQEIADTDLALSNSQVPVSVRLVGLAPTSYNESGNIDTDWKRLINFKDHKLDEIPALRDRVGADLVVLLDSAGTPGNSADTELQGEAAQLTGSLFGSPLQSQAAYLVINANALESLYDLAHEIGHTLGAAHAPGDPGTPGIRADANGYRFTGNDGQQYRDIMAYAPGITIPYFSNPNVLYQGVPTGTVGTSNIAAVMILTAPSVSGYRHASPFGALTATDGASISGWVIDPQDFTGSSTIQIKIDGILRATIPAADGVASLFTQFGASDHGFTYTLPLLTPGTHTVSIYAIDAMTGQSDFVASDPVTANHLVWTQQPRTLQAGQTIAAPPAITVEVPSGHTAADYHSTLTLSILSGPAGGTLTGTATATIINGIATFPGLSLSVAGTYVLQAFDGSIFASSAPITVNPGPAVQFTFQNEPAANITAGSAIVAHIGAVDAFGNTATLDHSKVSLTLTGTAGGTLNKSALASLNKGLAVFSGLSIARAGTYTLTAWQNGAAVATSTPFTVTAAAAAKIIFAALPANAVAESPIVDSIVADVVDRFGNLAGADNAAVTISLATRPKNAANPAGILVQNASAGMAAFAGLIFAAPGTYAIKAVQGKLAGTSTKFTVAPVAAAMESLNLLDLPI